LEPIDGPNGSKDTGRVRPLPSACLEELAFQEGIQQQVVEHLLRGAGNLPGAELRQDRRIAPGIGEVRGDGTLQIDVATDGVCRLQVGETLDFLLSVPLDTCLYRPAEFTGDIESAREPESTTYYALDATICEICTASRARIYRNDENRDYLA
jgi:hypothetical protein